MEVSNVSAPPDEACVLSVRVILRIFMNFKQYIQYRIFLLSDEGIRWHSETTHESSPKHFNL
jgi:hypothetical protein